MCIRSAEGSRRTSALAALAGAWMGVAAPAQGCPTRFDFGATATPEEIAAAAIAIPPDGDVSTRFRPSRSERPFQPRSMRLRRARTATGFPAAAHLLTEGCVIGRTSRMYLASASQKLLA
jgi:hypothetical protein